jgi:thiol:disulfide interchange protein DsbA
VKRTALIVLLASIVTLGCVAPAAAQSSASVVAAGASSAGGVAKFEADKDYQVLAPAQPTVGDAVRGKVEVAEVFMYSCPHCAAFEPQLQAWLKTAPAYVSFVRVPAIWGAVPELHARAYYTAEALGKTAEIDGPFFDEIHVRHNLLGPGGDQIVDQLAAFFAKFGVDDKTFRGTFYSFAVDGKVSRAADLVKRYKVPGTPAMIVNGKYLTNGAMAGSYDTWFAIIDELAAKEHAVGGGATH